MAVIRPQRVRRTGLVDGRYICSRFRVYWMGAHRPRQRFSFRESRYLIDRYVVIFPRAVQGKGKRVVMRLVIVNISLFVLCMFFVPVQAQEADLEGLRPGSPDAETESVDSSEVDSDDTEEVDPLKKLIDENPIDFDPLDALDGVNPLGKVEGLVDEISRNMKKIEELLDGDDTGQQNQAVQQQTLSRIDELITEVQKLTGS